jgi:hypothetical protein
MSGSKEFVFEGGSQTCLTCSPQFGSLTTGINEVTHQLISLYPNPAHDLIKIQNLEVTEVEIYNTLGQTIKIEGRVEEVNVSDLEAGVYYIKIKGTGSQLTQKIIVQH